MALQPTVTDTHIAHAQAVLPSLTASFWCSIGCVTPPPPSLTASFWCRPWALGISTPVCAQNQRAPWGSAVSTVDDEPEAGSRMGRTSMDGPSMNSLSTANRSVGLQVRVKVWGDVRNSLHQR